MVRFSRQDSRCDSSSMSHAFAVITREYRRNYSMAPWFSSREWIKESWGTWTRCLAMFCTQAHNVIYVTSLKCYIDRTGRGYGDFIDIYAVSVGINDAGGARRSAVQ